MPYGDGEGLSANLVAGVVYRVRLQTSHPRASTHALWRWLGVVSQSCCWGCLQHIVVLPVPGNTCIYSFASCCEWCPLVTPLHAAKVYHERLNMCELSFCVLRVSLLLRQFQGVSGFWQLVKTCIANLVIQAPLVLSLQLVATTCHQNLFHGGIPLWVSAEEARVHVPSRALLQLEPEQRRRISGNMMHVAVAGCVLGLSLTLL